MVKKTSDLIDNLDVVLVSTNDPSGGGFADNIRFVDGFFSFSDATGFAFLNLNLDASRSKTSEMDDPFEINFLNRRLSKHCFDLAFDVEHNYSVSVNLSWLVTGNKKFDKINKSDLNLYTEEWVCSVKQRLYDRIVECNLDHIFGSTETVLYVMLESEKNGIYRTLANKSPRLLSELRDWALSSSAFFGGRDNDSFNVVFHYRIGDTTVFPLENGNYISSWGSKKIPKGRAPVIVESIDDARYQQYSTKNYIDFIELIAVSVKKPVNITVISDGYDRGLKRISEHVSSLGITLDQLEYLNSWSVKNKKNIIKEFKDIASKLPVKSVNFFWGEDRENFYRSFGAIINGDIILGTGGTFSRVVFEYFNYIENSLFFKIDSSSSFKKAVDVFKFNYTSDTINNLEKSS